MSLVVTDVSKEYTTRAGSLAVLRGVNLSLARGDALAVMGPSGSGKSTLLHMLGTLDRPSAGSVTLEGTDPFALPERALAAFRNRRIGFVFQDHHLLPQCSVLENVLVPTLVSRDSSPAETEAYARQLLDRVGLATAQRNCQAANASASRWPARSCSSRCCYWPTSRRVTSTARTRSPSANYCSTCTGRRTTSSWS
jgi:ABC-type lipoprotein export system ATPase subunit